MLRLWLGLRLRLQLRLDGARSRPLGRLVLEEMPVPLLLLPRQPGQKEQRYTQLIYDEAAAPARDVSADVLGDGAGEDEDRLAAVERELRELRDEVAALRARLAAERDLDSAPPA